MNAEAGHDREIIESVEKDGYVLEKVQYEGHMRLHLRGVGSKSHSIFAAEVAHLIPETEINKIFNQIHSSRDDILDVFSQLSVQMKQEGRDKGVIMRSV